MFEMYSREKLNPKDNLIKGMNFIFTLTIILLLHELGHLIGHWLHGDFNAYMSVADNGRLFSIGLGVKGSVRVNDVFSFLLIPFTLQIGFLVSYRKTYWWMPYILWGYRFDWFDWINNGCILIS